VTRTGQRSRLLLIKDDYASKVAYGNKCVQAWKLRKDNMLKMAANQTKSGRLSVEEAKAIYEAAAERLRGEFHRRAA
jgi:hypothetical protein